MFQIWPFFSSDIFYGRNQDIDIISSKIFQAPSDSSLENQQVVIWLPKWRQRRKNGSKWLKIGLKRLKIYIRGEVLIKNGDMP